MANFPEVDCLSTLFCKCSNTRIVNCGNIFLKGLSHSVGKFPRWIAFKSYIPRCGLSIVAKFLWKIVTKHWQLFQKLDFGKFSEIRIVASSWQHFQGWIVTWHWQLSLNRIVIHHTGVVLATIPKEKRIVITAKAPTYWFTSSKAPTYWHSKH